MPPWFPTSPPSAPETIPATQPAVRPKRIHSDNPVRPAIPADVRSIANAIVRLRLLTTRCRSAPARPPAALISPKDFSTRRSTSWRRIHKRSAVARKCGIDTIATANGMSNRWLSTGVSRLPIPNPVTAATAPAKIETVAAMAGIHHARVTFRRSKRLSSSLEQLNRVSVGILNLNLLPARTDFHLISKTDPCLLQDVNARRKIGHAQNDAVPATGVLATAVGHRSRPRGAGPAQQNLERSKRHI